jgi:hypothetical protein
MTEFQSLEVSNYLTGTLGFKENGRDGLDHTVNGFYIQYTWYGLLSVRDENTYELYKRAFVSTLKQARRTLDKYIYAHLIVSVKDFSQAQTPKRATKQPTEQTAHYAILGVNTIEEFKDLREAVNFAVSHQPCFVNAALEQGRIRGAEMTSEFMLADDMLIHLRGDHAITDYIRDNYPDIG